MRTAELYEDICNALLRDFPGRLRGPNVLFSETRGAGPQTSLLSLTYDTIRKIICKRSLTDQYPLRECRAASSQKSTRAKHI